MTTKQEMKRRFLRCVKDMVIRDPQWLVRSYNTPNGFECNWSIAITRAVLRRHGLLAKTL